MSVKEQGLGHEEVSGAVEVVPVRRPAALRGHPAGVAVIVLTELAGGLLALVLIFGSSALFAWAFPGFYGRASHVVMTALALACACGWFLITAIVDELTWFEYLLVGGAAVHLKLAIGIRERGGRR